MAVIETIAPIFLLIIFGHVIQRLGLVKEQFISEANRFVFLFSLPFLIFTGIARSSLRDVAAGHIFAVLIPTAAVMILSTVVGFLGGLKKGRLGTFVQTTFHGNVTYIGLAVLLYMIGEEGLRRGSILIGFLILLNNTMAIAVLSWTSQKQRHTGRAMLAVVRSPVIIAAFLGLLVLYFSIPLPGILLRSMTLLGNIALPLALMIIGASMSPGTLRTSLGTSAVISGMKLLVLPYLSVLSCKAIGIPMTDGLTGVLLLATPVATTSYILAHQLGGDTDLASGAVTLSTLLSPVVFGLWVYVLKG